MKKLEIQTYSCWVAFLLLLCFISCKTRQAVTPTEVTTKIVTETVHDTLFKVEPDSSAIRALIECQNGKPVIKQIIKARSGKRMPPPKLNLKDNVLDCDCYADSLKLYAFWKSKQIDKSTVKYVPVVTEKDLTWWQKALMYVGAVAFIAGFIWFLKTIYNPFKFLKN